MLVPAQNMMRRTNAEFWTSVEWHDIARLPRVRVETERVCRGRRSLLLGLR